MSIIIQFVASVILGAILITVGMEIGENIAHDKTEQQVVALQKEAHLTQTMCIEEVERLHRVLLREINMQGEPTNGR